MILIPEDVPSAGEEEPALPEIVPTVKAPEVNYTQHVLTLLVTSLYNI